MKCRKVRDLTLISLDESKTMVIACDSCGGIGMKENDKLKVPPFYTGKFTVRVPIFEVVSAGAEIITITNAVCNEMEPTGSEVIRGILDELNACKIDNAVLTGSTEENFETTSTGIGITVIGIANNEKLKVQNVKDDAVIVSIGIPKVGDEINLEDDRDIANYNVLKQLLKSQEIYEIVPGGSKGLLYEAEEVAKSNNMILKLKTNIKTDIHKTCGPATALIAAMKENYAKFVLDNISNCEVIGYLKNMN